uniref:FecR family protein n=1 Tax=uncultured Sphingomonas sp. TaxID=158754 RepID=UPI0035C9A529
MTEQNDNIIRFPGESIAKTEADAARWLGRMTSGCATLSEVAEFALWRAASSDHERTYIELEAMWDSLAPGIHSRGLRQRAAPGWRGRMTATGWMARAGQIAAAVLMLATTGQYLTDWRYDYRTAPGEVRRVTLADGSTVQLAGGTALDAHVSSSGPRTIDLARGEAFFEVRHDPRRPFTVNAGGGVVRDIGTGFAVAHSGR